MSACAECGREIGWFGKLRRARYCSNEHRLRAMAYQRVQSATATVRERETSTDSAAQTALSALARSGPGPSGTSRYTIGFVLVLAVAVIVGIAGLPSRQTIETSGHLVDQEVRKRAAIRLYDNFQGKLDGWTPVAARLGRGEWTVEHGLLRPGTLRLWSDTASLTDYQFEFAAQIREKAVNWVYRAADANNYLACRLEVTRPGPLPLVDFVRFATANGKSGKAVRRPLPMTVRADTPYEVHMQIRGDDFCVTINGQIVDAWSEPAHPKGGVGFWSDKSESATIRYARVTERDDFTGRILADVLQPADKK